MISARKLRIAVEAWVPFLKTALGVKGKIKTFICRTTDMPHRMWDDACAVTVRKDNHSYEIYFFSNQTTTFKEAISTIIHEMIHVRFTPVARQILHHKKAYSIEEKFVLDMETMIRCITESALAIKLK